MPDDRDVQEIISTAAPDGAASDVRVPVAYPPDALLEPVHVGLYMGIHVTTVADLDLPWCYPTPRNKRILARKLYEWIEQQTAAQARHGARAGRRRPKSYAQRLAVAR
jgi:hypothetical protein